VGPRSQLRRLAAIAVVTLALGGAGLAAFRADSGQDAPDAAAARVIAAAKTHLGDKYVWGATGPDTWDCSGLTSTLWREVGGVPSIPRVSQGQAAWAIPVAAEDALPGDLVFFDAPVTHVALYLGAGRVIDASSARGGVVTRDVWSGGEVSYGRVPRPTAPPVRVVRASRPVAMAQRAPRIRVKEDGKLNAVPGLGSRSRHPARPAAARFAALARRAVGAGYSARGKGPAYDAGGLVAATWRRAGGSALPATPAALELRTTRVRVRDVVEGDLVFYGSPAVHVGIYVGGGRMVDASRVLHQVVLRAVFASDTVRFGRILPVAKRAVRTAPARRKAQGAKLGRKQRVRQPAVKPAHPTRKRSARRRTSPTG
jgi:cell wall-associated NlpC family hydrolase